MMPGATDSGDRRQNQSDSDPGPSSEKDSNRGEDERHANPLLCSPGLKVSIESDARRHG
jgi:hypothetical protein